VVGGHRDDDLAAETPAECQHAVPEFLALLVVHELARETLLEQAKLAGAFLALWAYSWGVHRSSLAGSGCGPGPGVLPHPRGHFLSWTHFSTLELLCQLRYTIGMTTTRHGGM
jgi:hypothetical protein